MLDHAKNYSNFNVVDDAETNSILHVFFGMKFQLTIKICKKQGGSFRKFLFPHEHISALIFTPLWYVLLSLLFPRDW